MSSTESISSSPQPLFVTDTVSVRSNLSRNRGSKHLVVITSLFLFAEQSKDVTWDKSLTVSNIRLVALSLCRSHHTGRQKYFFRPKTLCLSLGSVSQTSLADRAPYDLSWRLRKTFFFLFFTSTTSVLYSRFQTLERSKRPN